MDRRQRKSREAIFAALTELLSEKEFAQITVGEIIRRADVGRATFYAHFETKDYLLKELCAELFCHVLDAAHGEEHRHIFDCQAPESVFLHLLQHLRKNDNHILALLTSQNNELFLTYFRRGLERLIDSQWPLFAREKGDLPETFWKNHIAASFVETLKWWLRNGMKESPERITEYFFRVLI